MASNTRYSLIDTDGWVNITDHDPVHGFEKVDNLDFKIVQNSLDMLEKSVRLLGRFSAFAQPSSTLCTNEPKKLKPSAIECMTRSGPHVAEVILRNVQSAPEDPSEVVEIVVKNETNSNQMKLSMVEKRREPVTIEKVKKALVAELGGGDTSQFGFLLRGGHTNAYRLDNEVIRPPRTKKGKKRAVELVVRGIELPKPTEPQSSMNLSPAMSLRTVSSATFAVEEQTEFLKVPSLQGEAFSEWSMC